MHPPRKSINIITSARIDLATPINLSYMWNFGSMLGLILRLQVVTGLLLTMHYSPHIDTAFISVAHITRDVTWGWALRNFHANGASIFFILIYIHMLRGLIYISFKKSKTWSIGVTIYILTIATAFIGYLLPWGQIRFWGATVITNLFSALPYIGGPIVLWIWGGFAVRGPTLTRFFTLHFLLPFVLIALRVLHLLFLHETGSSGPLGTQTNIIKTPFHIHYSSKDILGFLIILLILSTLAIFFPNIFNDPENYIPANPLVTPTHIKPEWYFLWAYAILRSIPNKLGGVICIFAAIILLYTLPATKLYQKPAPMGTFSHIALIIVIRVFTILTWIGGNPVEEPYIALGITTTVIYFSLPLALLVKPKYHGGRLVQRI